MGCRARLPPRRARSPASTASTASPMASLTSTARPGRRTGPPAAGPFAASGREAVPVDQAHPLFQRVDAEPHPGQVDERQRGHQLDGHTVVGDQQLDRALGHHRRPRGRRRAPGRARRPPPPGPRRCRRTRRRCRRPARTGGRSRSRRRPRRPTGGGWCAGTAGDAPPRRRHPAVTRSGPPGPSPHTTTVGRAGRGAHPGLACRSGVALAGRGDRAVGATIVSCSGSHVPYCDRTEMSASA